MRPKQNGRHFADDFFKCIFLSENVVIFVKISLWFVRMDPIDYISVLVQVKACCRIDDTPLPEPMLTKMFDAIWRHYTSLYQNELTSHVSTPHIYGTKTLPSLFGDVLTSNPSRHTATRICFIVSLAINNFAYVSTDHPYSKWLTRSREISWHLENSNGKTGVIGRIIHYGCAVENCRAGKPWSHVTSPDHYWFNSLRPSDACILN